MANPTIIILICHHNKVHKDPCFLLMPFFWILPISNSLRFGNLEPRIGILNFFYPKDANGGAKCKTKLIGRFFIVLTSLRNLGITLSSELRLK